MTCTKCSAEFDDSFSFCPKCGAPAVKSEPVTPDTDVQEPSAPAYAQPEPQPVYSQPEPAYAQPAADPAEIQAPAKESFFKAPTKSAKSFAAIFSALTLIPVILILMIDYIGDYKVNSDWTGYIVGFLLVAWVCAVLPAIRITPTPVTAIICFFAIALYVLYIVKTNLETMEWFTMVALPLMIIITIFICLDSFLLSIKGITAFMPGLTATEAAIFCFVGGLLYSNYDESAKILPRIAIAAAAFLLIGAVALTAIGYIRKVNKSK